MRPSARQIAGIIIVIGLFVPSVAVAAARSQFTLPDVYHPARTLVLFEIFGALALFGWVAWARRHEIVLRTLLLGAAITGAGLVLRLATSQWAWFHENRHGYAYLLEILRGDPGYLPPSTYYVLMNFATWVGPPTEGTIFLVNALFSAATVPLVGLVARLVSGSRNAGWAGMLLWALSPYAIRLAATEVYFNVGLFFFTAALAALISGLRRTDATRLPIGELLLATLATALAAQTRATTLLWPATVLLVALGAGEIRTRQRWGALLAVGAGVAFLLLPKIFLHLGAGGEGARYLDPAGVYVNLRRLTALDRSVVSPVVPPLALLGGVLLIRGSRPLGVLTTAGLAAGAAYLGAVWAGLLVTTGRCDGFLCLPLELPTRIGPATPMVIGAGLAVGLTWLAARRRQPDAPPGTRSRWYGLVTLGLVIPAITASMITGAQVARLRFDLPPTGLLTILAGVGAGLVIDALPRRRRVRAAALGLLSAAALIPLGLLWHPYADSLEHRFLRDRVVPSLAASGDALRIVFPHESSKSSGVAPEWWRSHLQDAEVVGRLEDLEAPGDDSPVYAIIGYSCAWNHGYGRGDQYVDEDGVVWSYPPPYPASSNIEGEPRLHPSCADALAGRTWRAVHRLELPMVAMEGNVARVYPGLDRVVIGLYRSAGSVESLHTP